MSKLLFLHILIISVVNFRILESKILYMEHLNVASEVFLITKMTPGTQNK